MFNDEFIANTSDPITMNNEIRDYNERYRKMYADSPNNVENNIAENKYETMRRNLLTAALQNNSNNTSNHQNAAINGTNGENYVDSPLNSKTSSSDSLNYLLLRKDAFMEQQSSNSLDYQNGSSFAKKKSLKTTLYRMFTQRKKVQKMSRMQNVGQSGDMTAPTYSNTDQNYYSDLSQNQLTIKPDKNLKKK
jgi:hypothetical protein